MSQPRAKKVKVDHPLNSSSRTWNVCVRMVELSSSGNVRAKVRKPIRLSRTHPAPLHFFNGGEPSGTQLEFVEDTPAVTLPLPPNGAKCKCPCGSQTNLALKNPLKHWAGDNIQPGYRQEYLDEFVRCKGQGLNTPEVYTSCGEGKALYHCEECSEQRLECQECMVQHHVSLSLHYILKWTGSYFCRTSLKEMGLRVQVRHKDGTRCMAAEHGHCNFTVLHVNGIHAVTMDFCHCWLHIKHRRQLLWFGWFPAMVLQPHTIAIFACLDLFMACMLTGKMSTFDFYKSLTYLTDPLGLKIPKNRYKPLLRMVQEYRHLLLLMCGGKGNEWEGASNIDPGELAMECPACPRPGVNLPEDWRDAPDLLKYLYQKLVAIDANFHLWNLLRSDNIMDLGLHSSLAYFVEPIKYKEHVATYATQKDISTCSGFKTLAHAKTKNSAGLRATGVIMCLCAQHETVGRLSVGDLQKGERCCNADYVTVSALSPVTVDAVFFSYDIACQWFPGFRERVNRLPEDL